MIFIYAFLVVQSRLPPLTGIAVDPNLDHLHEIKGAVDPRTFNAGWVLANPDCRKSLFFASESMPSAASKTRRSLPCANCKCTVKKASEYTI
jgi:hypothetical protein